MKATPKFKAGDEVYNSGHPVIVLKQVLFNRPAYRVRCNKGLKSHQMTYEWVLDELYLSHDPDHRAGFEGIGQVRKGSKETKL